MPRPLYVKSKILGTVYTAVTFFVKGGSLEGDVYCLGLGLVGVIIEGPTVNLCSLFRLDLPQVNMDSSKQLIYAIQFFTWINSKRSCYYVFPSTGFFLTCTK